jgi:anti-anti-sigma factor
MPKFALHRREEDAAVVLSLAGELDMASADQVLEELDRVQSEGAAELVIDLSELTFMDSTGLRAILTADARSRLEGPKLTLVPGPEAVHRVFELTGMAGRLPFAGSAGE